MAAYEPIDPRVRLAISQWPEDSPRGRRTKADGPAAVLEPRQRPPKSNPSTPTDEVTQQAIGVRDAMGLDPVPSTASLARIFREAGVARREPKKEPRSAWRRFVHPAPNACWQLDGTEDV